MQKKKKKIDYNRVGNSFGFIDFSHKKRNFAVMISISKEQVSSLPVMEYDGRTIVINYPKDADKAIKYLLSQPIVGFDTETRPSFKKGHTHKVCLMQIATHTECFLFRLNKTGFTDSIREFLECENVTKVGLSLNDDLRALHKLDDFTPGAFIDLQSFVKKYDISDNSLQKIYAILFDKRISKGQRLTNWEADTLTPPQQAYASLDAKACLDIYDLLTTVGFDSESSPYVVKEEQED